MRYVVARWSNNVVGDQLNVLDLEAMPPGAVILRRIAGPFVLLADAQHALLVGIGSEPAGERCVSPGCYCTAAAHGAMCRLHAELAAVA